MKINPRKSLLIDRYAKATRAPIMTARAPVAVTIFSAPLPIPATVTVAGPPPAFEVDGVVVKIGVVIIGVVIIGVVMIGVVMTGVVRMGVVRTGVVTPPPPVLKRPVLSQRATFVVSR